MKKQFQLFRLFALATLFAISFSSQANNNAPRSNIQSFAFYTAFTYSWTGEANADTYVVQIKNLSSQETFSWMTPLTEVTALNIPNGLYEVKVTAIFPDTTTAIIIEELVQH